jgi:hypothetical protein
MMVEEASWLMERNEKQGHAPEIIRAFFQPCDGLGKTSNQFTTAQSLEGQLQFKALPFLESIN